MNNKLLIPIAIIIAGVLIAGVVIYNNNVNSSSEGVSQEGAGNKVIDFVNEKVLNGQATASLIDVFEENGIYKVKFSVEEEEVEWRISKDGQLIFPQAIDLEEESNSVEETGKTLGNFSVANDEIIREDGKPAVYFFGSESCPHCQWEHPIMEDVASEFEGYISFHNNMDNNADEEIFTKYSQDGYIPATIIGGKYYRVGSGENDGEEVNANNLRALICSITDNQPGEVCDQVQELINQI